jgi:putative addiction module component (TIGR02574 family)
LQWKLKDARPEILTGAGASCKFSSMSSDLILKESRALPLVERIALCRDLWDEVVNSKELAPGEAELIDQRLQEHLQNPDDVISWGEVKAKP